MLKYRKYFYIVSLSLVVGSIFSLVSLGLDFGMDFHGGSLIELEWRISGSATSTFVVPSDEKVRGVLDGFQRGEIVVQHIGGKGIIIRSSEMDGPTHEKVIAKLKEIAEFEEVRFESVGPVLGEEMKRKSVWAIGLGLIAILLYVAWSFRKVSYPVSSWKYGVIAIVALLHNILITLGIFVFISFFLKLEVGAPFIAALLTILGYSVNDTIVVFDRIRENVIKASSTLDFGEIINRSVRETYGRCLNTSLTTLFVLIAVFLLGGETTRYFALTIAIGIVIGTYSSLFIASPLLFSWFLGQSRRRG